MARLRPKLLFAVLIAGLPAGAAADAARNDFPSCEQSYFHHGAPPPERLFVAAVDRTADFPKDIIRDTVARVVRSITPGERIVVIGFSDITQDEFTVVKLDGTIDPDPPESAYEHELPANSVRDAMRCFELLHSYAQKKVATALLDLLNNPVSDSRQSLILKGLQTISAQVLAPSAAPVKQILVISDMLENSDVLSVYGSGRLRTLSVDASLRAIDKAGLRAQMRGAQVYVAGAAYPGRNGLHESQNARRALQAFWRRWFEAGGAALSIWGEPMLLQGIPTK